MALVLSAFVAAPAARAQHDASGPYLPRRFNFDGAFAGSPGLVFDFTRPVATRSPDGQPVSPDAPRYSPTATIASAPLLETVRVNGGQQRLMGSGLDHDGTTPLMVLADLSHQHFDVFTVAGDALRLAEQGGAGRIRTAIARGAYNDLLAGAVPGKLYAPRAGTVCHGLIVVLCEVMTDVSPPSGNWRSSAVAFVISQDQGRTWQLQFEDAPVNPGVRRVETWSMQNWWPVERVAHPLEAYFLATDYRHQPSTRGGRAYMFRARRISAGSPWSLEPTTIVYETEGPDPQHAHTAGLLPFGGGGLRVVTSVGDCQTHSRITSTTREDASYLDPGWTVQEDYHGSQASGIDPGVWANQFVGCAPGPAADEMVTGSDVATEVIVSASAGEPGAPHPRTRFVYGLPVADGSYTSNAFFLRTPTPERGGPYCAFSHTVLDSNQLVPLSANRMLYSPDGVHWTQAFATPSDLGTGCIHGEHIYYESTVPGGTLERARIPRTRTGRPLLIGPGGLQRNVASPSFSTVQPGGITPLTQAQGLWMFEGRPLAPQPPSSGQVFHVKGSRFAATPEIGRLHLTGDVAAAREVSGTSALQMRVWVMNNSEAGSADARFDLGGPWGSLGRARWIRAHSVDSWIPVMLLDSVGVAATDPIHLRIDAGSGFCPSPSVPADLDVFVAVDALAEGPGCPGYPMPMSDATPGGSYHPDELGTVAGFRCGPAWTITLAGQLPADAWDGTVPTVGRWPLATLWGDASNSIELVADTADPFDSRMLARVIRDHEVVEELRSEPLFWLRGSALLVSVSDTGDGRGIHVTASAAGSPIQELQATRSPAPVSLAVQPGEIRFGASADTSGGASLVRVAPMLWWGGEIRETQALVGPQRAEQLACIQFLGPLAPTTLDGDLVCGSVDNCPSLVNPDQIDQDEDGVGDACDNCPLDRNATQADLDADAVGDICDLDDGEIWIRFSDRDHIRWQSDGEFDSWNVYRGALGALRSTGIYTQDPGSTVLARRDCGVVDPVVDDAEAPPFGEVVFSLVSGVRGGVEGSLGKDGSGNERTNTHPCP